MNSLVENFPKQRREAGLVQLMGRDGDHGVVELFLDVWSSACSNFVQFQKIKHGNWLLCEFAKQGIILSEYFPLRLCDARFAARSRIPLVQQCTQFVHGLFHFEKLSRSKSLQRCIYFSNGHQTILANSSHLASSFSNPIISIP